MSDREEMRWKFQQVQEIVTMSRLEHDKERDNHLQDWNDLYDQVVSGRNTILGGIGFVILLIVALTSIDGIYKEYLWLIVVLIVIGLSIFVLTNIWLNLIGKRVYLIDEIYKQQILELVEVESWFIGCSLDENITKEQLVLLVYFISDYVQALSYLLKDNYYKIHKKEHQEHEEFREAWDNTKNHYNNYEKLNKNAKKQIENFIKIYEENEKKRILPDGITKINN